MIKLIGVSTRMTFRAFVVAMLILNSNHEWIWAVPLGLIIGLCSEAENITKQ